MTSPKPISRETLANLLLDGNSTNTIGIIDVRDADHIGGHILNSQNVPSSTLDVSLPELVRTLRSKKTVVFHCMLSQQRGPRAARRYVEERERERGRAADTSGAAGVEEGKEGWMEQEVFVLTGGFDGWQQVYGKDERLTANYAEDIFNSLW